MVFLAALETALRTDFGFSRATGFPETGLFPIYLTGPTDLAFNFADCGERVGSAPQLFWLARRFDRPIYAWYERRERAPEPLDLVWFDPRGSGPTESDLALDRHFRGAEVMSMRSAWDDGNAVFVVFKAGDNKSNHSNLDLGSFVLDASGYRWAIDRGADDSCIPRFIKRMARVILLIIKKKACR